jgi:hypothetical protein
VIDAVSKLHRTDCKLDVHVTLDLPVAFGVAEETVICRSFVQFCANFFGAGANNDVILLFVRGLTCGRNRRLLYIQTIPYSLALPRGGVRVLRGDDLRESRTNTPAAWFPSKLMRRSLRAGRRHRLKRSVVS